MHNIKNIYTTYYDYYCYYQICSLSSTHHLLLSFLLLSPSPKKKATNSDYVCVCVSSGVSIKEIEINLGTDDA